MDPKLIETIMRHKQMAEQLQVKMREVDVDEAPVSEFREAIGKVIDNNQGKLTIVNLGASVTHLVAYALCHLTPELRTVFMMAITATAMQTAAAWDEEQKDKPSSAEPIKH